MTEKLSPRDGIDLVDSNRKVTLEWGRFFKSIKDRLDDADVLFASLNSRLDENTQEIEDLEGSLAHLMMSQGISEDTPTPAMTDAPIGTLLPFCGAFAPPGYLDANGSAVSRSAYAALFAVTGTAFGPGDGSTTFNLPDMPGNFLKGSGGGTGISIGDTGGSSGSVNLAHTHDVTVPPVTVQSGTGATAGQAGTFTSTSALGATTTEPPWVAFRFIIRYA